MTLMAALIYWVAVALWFVVLVAICTFSLRNPKTIGITRLLLAALAVDTLRNIVENLYFGVYFGAQYGLFPSAVVAVMGQPELLIIPAVINVAAAGIVLGVLLLRGLPTSLRERQMSEDVAREKSAALAQEIEENSRLFQTSADLIIVAGPDRVITRVSESCLAVLGYTQQEMIGRHGGDFMASNSLELLRREMKRVSREAVIRNFSVDFRHRDGRTITLALTGVWSDPVRRFFIIGRDTTERREAEKELTRLAHHDQLTGLLNRTSLLADLDRLHAKSRNANSSYAVATLDLDGFKAVNDSLGHMAGDRLLKEVAQRLKHAAGDRARTYRMGGDEFVMVFPTCEDPLMIGGVVGGALKSMEVGFDIDSSRFTLAASAGIALAARDQTTSCDILVDADLALYDAKAAGGGAYRLFTRTMRSRVVARQQLDTELRQACYHRQFELFYQPQIRLSDGAVVGAEALLRWHHPRRGLLAPASFIEPLSQSSVALEVGNWILRTACEDAAGWRAMGLPEVRVGVNLFPAQFHDQMLALDVETALSASGLPASALELEITENIALTDDEAVLASLRALRRIGVGLAFDDFGTGYASLSFLTRYPLTRLKIDRSFVQKIGTAESPQHSAIVRSIILMAHNLGLQVVAEGVETAMQARLLKTKKCDEAQGYHYSKPMPASDFEAFLRASAAALDDADNMVRLG
jgi:diguanylate cyclase (GGDEF)-like protein/PAS domain S-box-containing protein